MSYLSSLKKTKNKIIQKQICIIEGNVDDFMMINDMEMKEICDGNNLITLPQYLTWMLKQIEFTEIKYYNPSTNVIPAHDGILNINNQNHHENLDSYNDQNMSFNQFIAKIQQEIDFIKKANPVNSKKAYIIDFGEALLSYMNSETTYSQIAELISSFISVFSQSIINYIDSSYKLIIICRNKNDLSKLFNFKSCEITNHVIQKPDKLERRKFITKFASTFSFVDGYNLLDVNELDLACSLTNDFSFREIFQMIRVNQYYQVNNFKELYNLVTFNKKESEWEKIDNKKIKTLSTFLNERVRGQSEAIKQIEQTIIRSFVGLSGIAQSQFNTKPKGILFFSGPTGVGKTELAKAITEFVFGNQNQFIRFDMSEYNLEHSDQKLIGAPPGYVGYESGGQLTNAVKEKPFSILLFDEIEKAHGKVLDKFLQILEDGRLTSSKGELIDFSETFIIFTSNIGSENINNISSDYLVNKSAYIDAIKEYFVERLNRPEILNRIGIKNIVTFNYIVNDDVIKEIINYKFSQLKDKLLNEKNINLFQKNDDDFDKLISLIKNEYQPKLGGRGLVMTFEHIFIDELANFIFEQSEYFSKINSIHYVYYTIENGLLFFEIK